MLRARLVAILAAFTLAACGEDTGNQAQAPAAHWVLTVPLRATSDQRLQLSGTVRARFETPLAFQVGGRILQRRANAGEKVTPGQVLFRLDPRDFDQALRIAEAELAAARAARETAVSELSRQEQLVAQNFVSAQSLARFRLAEQDARSRVDAAAASLASARHQREYADLRLAQGGGLIEVRGEPGQVVAAGEPVALLAQRGEREIEVFLPDVGPAPVQGTVRWRDQPPRAIHLREVAGSADPASRTWRARYQLDDSDESLPLGVVVQVDLHETGSSQRFALPFSALDERGEGPRIWTLRDGEAHPVSVSIAGLRDDRVLVAVDLPAGTPVIRLGTHLLEPGQAVRERRQ